MLVENLFLNVVLWALIGCGAVICAVLAYYLIVWIYLYVSSLCINTKKEYTTHSKFWWAQYVLGVKMICRTCRIKIHSSGVEKVPFGTRFLMVSNHRSNFDNIAQGVVLKKEHVSYISKPENFKIPFAGPFITRNGFLSIERDNMRQSAQTILKAINYIKNDVFSIGVFPEGTRSKDGLLRDFKPGCFKIAEKSKCPIVVIATQGTEKVHKNYPFHRTHVYIDIIDVLYPEQYEGLGTVALSDKIHQMIADFLGPEWVAKPEENAAEETAAASN